MEWSDSVLADGFYIKQLHSPYYLNMFVIIVSGSGCCFLILRYQRMFLVFEYHLSLFIVGLILLFYSMFFHIECEK